MQCHRQCTSTEVIPPQSSEFTTVDDVEATQGFLVQGDVSSLNVYGRLRLSDAVNFVDDSARGTFGLIWHCLPLDNGCCS